MKKIIGNIEEFEDERNKLNKDRKSDTLEKMFKKIKKYPEIFDNPDEIKDMKELGFDILMTEREIQKLVSNYEEPLKNMINSKVLIEKIKESILMTKQELTDLVLTKDDDLQYHILTCSNKYTFKKDPPKYKTKEINHNITKICTINCLLEEGGVGTHFVKIKTEPHFWRFNLGKCEIFIKNSDSNIYKEQQKFLKKEILRMKKEKKVLKKLLEDEKKQLQKETTEIEKLKDDVCSWFLMLEAIFGKTTTKFGRNEETD